MSGTNSSNSSNQMAVPQAREKRESAFPGGFLHDCHQLKSG